ncbi:MAG: hypothetical protein ACKO0Z_17970 [Betaproteobacteria bacterium]
MLRKLFLVALIFSSSAVAAEDFSKVSTERLCSKYANPSSKLFMRPDVADEIVRRGAGYCMDPSYIAAKRAERERQADALMDLSNQLRAADNNRRGTMVPNYPSPAGSARGFYLSEVISGMNKICYYNRVGSTVALTISAAQACPPTY